MKNEKLTDKELFEEHPKNEFTEDECTYCSSIRAVAMDKGASEKEASVLRCMKHATLQSLLDQSTNFTRHTDKVFPAQGGVEGLARVLQLGNLKIYYREGEWRVIFKGKNDVPFTFRVGDKEAAKVPENVLIDWMVCYMVAEHYDFIEMPTAKFHGDVLEVMDKDSWDSIHDMGLYKVFNVLHTCLGR